MFRRHIYYFVACVLCNVCSWFSVGHADEPKDEQKTSSPGPSTPRIDPAAQLLERLHPERLNTLAEMIEQDWPSRPEWAEMALAVMRGRAMQPGAGWWRPSDKKYGWTWLKRQYDKNSDNIVQREEFPNDSPRSDLFFQRLDRSIDGKLTTADFDVSLNQEATPAAMKERVTRFLFFRLDTDSNGQVTKGEMAEFFDQSDREKTSFLTSEDLLEALAEQEPRGSAESDMPSTSKLLSMFFNGELGWFEEGPKLGDEAPDFTLGTHDRSSTLTLSQFRNNKPVVLIFGSFT